MRTGRTLGALFLFLASVPVHAQTQACEEWKSKLKAQISAANGCERQHQTCLGMGPTNPMRELNYCRNLLKKCESLEGDIGSEALKQQVEQYRKQCS